MPPAQGDKPDATGACAPNLMCFSQAIPINAVNPNASKFTCDPIQNFNNGSNGYTGPNGHKYCPVWETCDPYLGSTVPCTPLPGCLFRSASGTISQGHCETSAPKCYDGSVGNNAANAVTNDCHTGICCNGPEPVLGASTISNSVPGTLSVQNTSTGQIYTATDSLVYTQETGTYSNSAFQLGTLPADLSDYPAY